MPNTFYRYKIEASNEHFAISTNNIIIQTPPTKFTLPCDNSTHLSNTSKSSIILLNVLQVDFELIDATTILVSYNLSEWTKLIKCLSEVKYPQSNVDLNEFVIKILMQSVVDGLQALEFPYPNPNSNSNRVEIKISGKY